MRHKDSMVKHITLTHHENNTIVVSVDRVGHIGKRSINPSNASLDRIARLAESGAIVPAFCWWRASGLYKGESVMTFRPKGA